VIRAVNEAKATNAERRTELEAVRRNIKKQYTTKEAQERALARHMRGIDEEHTKATKAWQREQARGEARERDIDRQIDEERNRWNESERRATLAETEAAEKSRQQAVADQIKADKDAARLALARQREEARQAKEADPVRSYNAELRRRAAYVDALRRGDDYYASQLAPEADHAKMQAAIKAIESADPGSSDYRKIKKHLDALKKQPLPQRQDVVP
jgi:hypothetical protein